MFSVPDASNRDRKNDASAPHHNVESLKGIPSSSMQPDSSLLPSPFTPPSPPYPEAKKHSSPHTLHSTSPPPRQDALLVSDLSRPHVSSRPPLPPASDPHSSPLSGPDIPPHLLHGVIKTGVEHGHEYARLLLSRQSYQTSLSILHQSLYAYIKVSSSNTTSVTAPKGSIKTEVNVFNKDGFYNSHIDINPICTRIHAYLTQEERELYTPNTFFYADGRFSAAQSAVGTLKISVQALSLSRHPDDVSDFEEYRRYLPGQWCPMVTVIGSVPPPSDNTSDPSEPRRFTVETSVYDASKASPVPFSVACFFENTKRWQKVRTPSPGALLSITAKVAGRTTDTNQLALAKEKKEKKKGRRLVATEGRMGLNKEGKTAL
ncbi:hypothetical protein B0J13DRAFT_649681 [Dactylonectria estremocensis]|uniref:Uncharacterized protein n=1 Tax=Dactylonectria estremocensis TaxID=1079267 RepID=A0A9P9IHF4_9HYPO|nr:hypothetical protein B0J13DRAFT_649681 [Dactylonectria estremocensis]